MVIRLAQPHKGHLVDAGLPILCNITVHCASNVTPLPLQALTHQTAQGREGIVYLIVLFFYFSHPMHLSPLSLSPTIVIAW